MLADPTNTHPTIHGFNEAEARAPRMHAQIVGHAIIDRVLQ